MLAEFVQALDRELRLDHRVGRAESEALARPPGVDLPPPLGQRLGIRLIALGFPRRAHVGDHRACVADDRDVGMDVLIDRGGIDVDVDDLGVGREAVDLAGDPVVEARADRHHHVAAVHREVGFVGAVHAEHAEKLGIRRRERAQALEGQGDRVAGGVDEIGERGARLRAGVDHAAAAVEHRALGRGHQRHRLLDLGGIALDRRAIRLVPHLLGLDVGSLGNLDVLRQIDHHRAGTTGARDMKRLVQHARQGFHVLDQVVVLGAGAGDAGGVGLLEGVGADQLGRNLARQADQRHGIEERVEQAGDRIGRAGAGGDQHHADLAGGAGIALRRMHRRLFVAGEDVADAVLLEDRVVKRKYGAARIAEYDLDALVDQGLEDNFRSGHALLQHPFGSIDFTHRNAPRRPRGRKRASYL